MLGCTDCRSSVLLFKPATLDPRSDKSKVCSMCRTIHGSAIARNLLALSASKGSLEGSASNLDELKFTAEVG